VVVDRNVRSTPGSTSAYVTVDDVPDPAACAAPTNRWDTEWFASTSIEASLLSSA
jgi:hypothetical protein